MIPQTEGKKKKQKKNSKPENAIKNSHFRFNKKNNSLKGCIFNGNVSRKCMVGHKTLNQWFL